jgi:hypothetical protein
MAALLSPSYVCIESFMASNDKARPVDVTQQNTDQIRQNLFPEGTLPTRKIKWKYNIGDKVRISRALGVFNKGFDPQFTDEVNFLKR